MAKNIFGEQVEPRKLTFGYLRPHMEVFRAGKFAGCVSPNGWTGKTMFIDYEMKEPVLTNYDGPISLSEMQTIIDKWKEFTK